MSQNSIWNKVKNGGIDLSSLDNPILELIVITFTSVLGHKPAYAPDVPDDVKIKPKPEEPVNQPVETPTPPDFIVKPPPRVIYPNPNNPSPPSNFQITIPELPTRPEPAPPQTGGSFDSEFTYTIGETLKTRKFGCMLPKPYINVDWEICRYVEEPSTFYDDWINRLLNNALQIIEDYLLDTATDKIMTACKWSVLRLPLPFLAKGIAIIGCSFIDELSDYYFGRNKIIDNLPVTGLINTGNYNIVDCIIPRDETSGEDFELDFGINEVAVPLESYDISTGKKHNQLQIIFRDEDYQNTKKTRSITLPSPIKVEDINIDVLTNNIPSSYKFGSTLYKLAIKLDSANDFAQKLTVKIYGTGENDSEYQQSINEYQSWLNNLTDNTEIISWSAIKLDNDTLEPIYESTFNPYKAVYMGWIEQDGYTQWDLQGVWYFPQV